MPGKFNLHSLTSGSGSNTEAMHVMYANERRSRRFLVCLHRGSEWWVRRFRDARPKMKYGEAFSPSCIFFSFCQNVAVKFSVLAHERGAKLAYLTQPGRHRRTWLQMGDRANSIMF